MRSGTLMPLISILKGNFGGYIDGFYTKNSRITFKGQDSKRGEGSFIVFHWSKGVKAN